MTKKTKKTVPSVKTVRRLSAAQLCFICDPKSLGFKSTNDLESPSEIIGQDRAVAAIQFGVGIDKEGYNMFALGPSGAGKHSVIRQFLDGRAGDMPTPPDTCYVNNFIQSYKPVLIQLPAGRGAGLRQDMAQLVEMVNVAIPRAFEGDEYRHRRQKLEAHFKEAQEALFEGVHKEAHDNAINVRRTSGGLVMSPMKDGEPIEPEVFQKLPEAEQKRVHDIIEMLEEKLRNALAEMPALERQFREDIQEINQGITVFAIGHLIDDLKNRYGDVANVQAYLDAVRKDMVAHAENFLPPSPTPDPAGGTGQSAEERDPNFLVRYQVNLLVDHSADDGAPVVYEDLPNLQSLIGRIEHIAQYGALSTNFTLIQPGALHRANGGYLILDARKILTAPFAWDELKRVLKSREIRIESPERLMSVATTVTLEPAPTPLDVKVVLLGERGLYYTLTQSDPEFNELFKVEVDFEETWDRTPENMQLFSRFLASVIRKQNLKPFSAPAVARVIEHAARLAGHIDQMTTHSRTISDLLDEADYCAGTNGKKIVGPKDVQQALDAKVERADRIRDITYQSISQKTVLMDTKGAVTGQLNALAVLQLGKFPFGRPSRITARVRLGRGQVVDIEREVELGGPLHAKGVLILSAVLGARYCPDLPLSLSASLVFEQSYSGIDGDSASSTELYALLSALADVPIKQCFAVTGSVNQFGEVQAIGGANEKIEGFFDVCQMDGLTGEQGVLIPQSNVQHLMLRHDVIDAVRKNKFHIYPIAHIDEGITVLTGVNAGARDKHGNFPTGTINAKVEARLQAFAAAAAKAAGHTDKKQD